jgi:hypothetical protein
VVGDGVPLKVLARPYDVRHILVVRHAEALEPAELGPDEVRESLAGVIVQVGHVQPGDLRHFATPKIESHR